MESISPVSAGLFSYQRPSRRSNAMMHESVSYEDEADTEHEAPLEAGPAFSPLSIEALEVLSNIDGTVAAPVVPRQRSLRVGRREYALDNADGTIKLDRPLTGRRSSDQVEGKPVTDRRSTKR